MNRTIHSAIALLATVALARLVHAGYYGLVSTAANSTVTLNADVPSLVNVPVTIHRVWATFTNPNDQLLNWGGGGSLGPCIIRNTNAAGTGFGTGFLNHVDGGLLPPNSSTAISDADSYFTINLTKLNQVPPGLGVTLNPLPGNPPDVTGNPITLTNSGGGVFTTPISVITGATNPISLAGFSGDGDALYRVLLMHLTVRQSEGVTCTLGITIKPFLGNNTMLQNQTPLLSPTGVCCGASGNCGISTLESCPARDFFIFGGSCPDCNGACCAGGGCFITNIANCSASGGTFHGPGSLCAGACLLGDVDGDTHVDVDDLLAVITAWGPCPAPCPPCVGDVDSNCAVDVNDLLAVISNWSP